MTDELFAVTGATGFIGRNLVTSLLAKRHRVRALVRRQQEYAEVADVRRIDVFDKVPLMEALEGVYTAFYLVHSMKNKGREFAQIIIILGRSRH